MGVVIEICVKHPGGPTRIRGADVCILYSATTRTAQRHTRLVITEPAFRYYEMISTCTCCSRTKGGLVRVRVLERHTRLVITRLVITEVRYDNAIAPV